MARKRWMRVSGAGLAGLALAVFAHAQIPTPTATAVGPWRTGVAVTCPAGTPSAGKVIPAQTVIPADIANASDAQQIAYVCGAGAGADASATTTGSLTGDMVNMGANLWIIQNVKNPYTAVFLQNFSKGFITGLVSANAEAQRQRQMQFEAMQRQQQQAAEAAREAEQARINALFARLNQELKLHGGSAALNFKTSGGGDQLALKNSGGDDQLTFKMGDSGGGQGYGIPGLPGVYTGGAASGGTGLQMKLGDSGAPPPADASAPTAAAPGGGIVGLPGIYLSDADPAQAPELAGAASSLTGPERGLAEDAALQAAQKNPALTAPSDDPFVGDYQKDAQDYAAAQQQQQAAWQQASEAAGHLQADQAAIAYAQTQVALPTATADQKQALQGMMAAAQTDEAAAVAARQAFEQTDVHLAIARDRAADALAGLGRPAANPVSTPAPVAAADTPLLDANASPARLRPASPPPPPPAPIVVPAPFVASPPRPSVPPAAGARPPGESPAACIARIVPGPAAAPSLDELKAQLDRDQTAYDRLYQEAESERQRHNEWVDEMYKATRDAGWGMFDHGADGLLQSSKDSLEESRAALEAEAGPLREEIATFRQQVVAAGEKGADPAQLAAFRAQVQQYQQQAAPLLERRKTIEDGLANIAGAESTLQQFGTSRDFAFWLQEQGLLGGDEKSPTEKQADAQQDQLDALKDMIKMGAQAAAEVSPVGAPVVLASLMIDLGYDFAVDAAGLSQLRQMGQNAAKFDQAKAALSRRLARTNAELACYQGGN